VYAWRGRLGLINPTHRGKVFAFWYRNIPDGFEIVPTFIGFRKGEKQDFAASFARAEQLAAELKDVGCTILALSGTPPFLLKGPEFERDWGARMTLATGLPIVTPVRPHVNALRAMAVRRVAVATYYGDELNDAVVRYFATFGIEAFVMGGYRERMRKHVEGMRRCAAANTPATSVTACALVMTTPMPSFAPRNSATMVPSSA